METNVTMHFTIEELYASSTATKLGINNKPNVQHVINLVYLAAFVLEPLRVAMNEPIKISSGFRSRELNQRWAAYIIHSTARVRLQTST